MASTFTLHPQLAGDSRELGDLPLCRVLLMNDRQYPWVILVPRRADLREIYQLAAADLQQFWRESAQLSRVLMEICKGEKLNVAALGNMVPQLHVHHIVRYAGDAAWPAPVWGKLPVLPYDAETLRSRTAMICSGLQAEFGTDFRPPAS